MLSNNHILYNNVDIQHLVSVEVFSPAPSLSIAPVRIGTVTETPPECKLTSAPNDGDYAIADIDDKARVSTTPQPGMPALHEPIDPNSAAGKPVKKAGAATGITSGRVAGIMHDFSVTYDSMGGATFTFKDQVRVEPDTLKPFSDIGDSGSLVVTLDGDAVGIAFALSGSDTMASPLKKLFDTLGLSFA
jgi:hypothetical protein